MGCVLLQKQPKSLPRPVGYWSRSLKKAWQAYDTTERDFIAVVWEVKPLEPYIQGTRITIPTDHEDVRSVLNMNDAKGRIDRRRLRISVFDYEIFPRTGVKYQAGDALSRLETEVADTKPIEDDIRL